MKEIIIGILIVTIGIVVCFITYHVIKAVENWKSQEFQLTRDTAEFALEQMKVEAEREKEKADDENEKERIRLEDEARQQSLEMKMGKIVKIESYLWLTDRTLDRLVSKLDAERFSELNLDSKQVKDLYKLAYTEGHEDGFNGCKKTVLDIIS